MAIQAGWGEVCRGDHSQALPWSQSMRDISSSISRSSSFMFLQRTSLSNLGRTICVLACGLPVLERISVLMFFSSCVQKQPWSYSYSSKSSQSQCSIVLVERWTLRQSLTGLEVSPVGGFLGRGLAGAEGVEGALVGVGVGLPMGDLVMGSMPLRGFLWLSGFSCCLLYIFLSQLRNITDVLSLPPPPPTPIPPTRPPLFVYSQYGEVMMVFECVWLESSIIQTMQPNAEQQEILVEDHSSSPEDLYFDQVASALQDIVFAGDFELIQGEFMRKHCALFEETEENKNQYMDVFKLYQEEIERYVAKELAERVQQFEMERFLLLLQARPEQLDEQILDTLQSFTDFQVFKQLMLEYKAYLTSQAMQGLAVRSTRLQ